MSQPERNDTAASSLARVLSAIRHGDRDGFDRLLGEYRPLISGIVTSQMSERLRAVLDPEDVVQDVLLAAYRGAEEASFDGEAGFAAWLRVLTTNRLIDLDRRHFQTARRPTNVLSLDETVYPDAGLHRGDMVAGDRPGPSTILGRREMAERLDRALANCRRKDRELIRAVFVENLSINEIAARLGKKPAAVRKALSRALDSCREAIRFLPPPIQDGHA